jgi:hypothetical protein
MAVKANDWGVKEGMTLGEVNRIMAQHGFEVYEFKGAGAALMARLGPDPPGYKTPCWRHPQTHVDVTSTFKNGGLVDFHHR